MPKMEIQSLNSARKTNCKEVWVAAALVYGASCHSE